MYICTAESFSIIDFKINNNNNNNQEDITLLWGVNVIASVVGTVLATMSSMVIGFNGNLLIGIGLYLSALASAITALKISRKVDKPQAVK